MPENEENIAQNNNPEPNPIPPVNFAEDPIFDLGIDPNGNPVGPEEPALTTQEFITWNSDTSTTTTITLDRFVSQAQEDMLNNLRTTSRQRVTIVEGTAGESIWRSYEPSLEKESTEERKLPKWVKLYEGGKKVDSDTVVEIRNIGLFLKSDKRVVKDFLVKDYYILVDQKYARSLRDMFIMYNDINAETGELINPSYTVSEDIYGLHPEISSNTIKLAETNIRNTFISYSLLSNPVFNKFYKEDLNTCKFYDIHKVDPTGLVKNPKRAYRKKLSSYYDKSKDINKPSTYISTYGKKYTFGLEIETSSGVLPYYFDKRIDYTAVHDGSLRAEDGNVYGGEYVTGVLKGDQGLQMSRLLCNELTKRCNLNVKCGVHVHLGDVSFNKENIILMYYLFQKLEQEILSIFPPSRRGNEYCRNLTPIKIEPKNMLTEHSYYVQNYYNDIIKLLSQKDVCNKNINKKFDHPKGVKCGYDHSAHRYCWVNFIPAVFNTRKNGIYTIEFRPHAASTSYKKIKNWLLICMALVDVIENHKSDIYNNENITLNDVLTLAYGKNSLGLINYVEKRRLKFSAEENHDLNETLDNEIEENLSIKNL